MPGRIHPKPPHRIQPQEKIKESDDPFEKAHLALSEECSIPSKGKISSYEAFSELTDVPYTKETKEAFFDVISALIQEIK